jgi:hypothetical protein
MINLVIIPPCEQHLVWFSSKNNNLCPINCKCDQFNNNNILLHNDHKDDDIQMINVFIKN